MFCYHTFVEYVCIGHSFHRRSSYREDWEKNQSWKAPHCKAHVVSCVATVIKLDFIEDLNKLTDYKHWRSLSRSEISRLKSLVQDYNPRALKGWVFFYDPQRCVNFSNEFYELSVASTFLHVEVNRDMEFGATRRAYVATEIMTYTEEWVNKNYYDALEELNTCCLIILPCCYPWSFWKSNWRKIPRCCRCFIIIIVVVVLLGIFIIIVS